MSNTTTAIGRTYDAAEAEYEKLGDELRRMRDDDPRAQPFIAAATAWALELYREDGECCGRQAIENARLGEGGLINGLAVMLFG